MMPEAVSTGHAKQPYAYTENITPENSFSDDRMDVVRFSLERQDLDVDDDDAFNAMTHGIAGPLRRTQCKELAPPTRSVASVTQAPASLSVFTFRRAVPHQTRGHEELSGQIDEIARDHVPLAFWREVVFWAAGSREKDFSARIVSMRSLLRRAWALMLPCGLLASCGGGGGGGGGGGTPGGGGGSAFIGLWQYTQGSFAFVNCYTSSRNNDLTRTGFQIVNEAGNLVRISLDGCRFKVVQTTATHATGVAGEECTFSGTFPNGTPYTGHYRQKTLVMELKPSDASQMVEVFDVDAQLTDTLGTVSCEISGNNTLNRAP